MYESEADKVNNRYALLSLVSVGIGILSFIVIGILVILQLKSDIKVGREYKVLTEYQTSNYGTKHPAHDEDLVGYGCPICGYQLYISTVAEDIPYTEIRCTFCNFVSPSVYIKDGTIEETKTKIVELYKSGNLTEDYRFDK